MYLLCFFIPLGSSTAECLLKHCSKTHRMESKPTDIVTYQLHPLGDSAVVLQFGDTIDQQVHRRITVLAAYLSGHTFPGFIELVPAYTTITVYYDPWVVSRKGEIDPYQKVIEFLHRRLANAPSSDTSLNPDIIEIPVCYGGSFGPDLANVAAHSNLSEEEVITLHATAEYMVYMIGFAPGFPYLGGLNAKIATPRKQTPSAKIPAGSVGIAGSQTGIYPIETPGGWQLIGRTPLRLFDPDRKKPALIQAGDMVKFIPITEEEYHLRKEQSV